MTKATGEGDEEGEGEQQEREKTKMERGAVGAEGGTESSNKVPQNSSL